MISWIKARWPEFSTRVGLVLAALSGAIPAYAPSNPDIAYLGLIVAALLVAFPERKSV